MDLKVGQKVARFNVTKVELGGGDEYQVGPVGKVLSVSEKDPPTEPRVNARGVVQDMDPTEGGVAIEWAAGSVSHYSKAQIEEMRIRPVAG
jgi:hypothetical protein